MQRLLRLADVLTGADARRRVFEPLLADWQRELGQARGTVARISAAISGSFAFVRALAVCAATDGVWIPPLRGMLLSAVAVPAAIGVSIAVLLIGTAPPYVPRDLSEPMAQRWVSIWSVTIVPPAFLLATFLLRCDRRATIRHGILFILIVTAAASALVVTTTDDALRRRYDTFEMSERIRERNIAAIRAGKIVKDGGRYQRELQTTSEERRARFDRFHAQLDAWRQKDPPPTWSERLTEWSPVLLSAVFAAMGWMLAGLARPTIGRGIAWWGLMFTAVVAMTRILSYLIGVPMPRPPQWVMPAVFVAVTAALAMHAIRSHKPMRPL